MADTNIKFLFGTEANFIDNTKKPSNVNGSVYFTTVDTTKGYLYFGDGTNFLNIVPKLLNVANGGTGKTSLDSGKALIGNGTGAVNLRSITNNGSATYITKSTNLITANTLGNWTGAYDSNNNSNIKYLGTIGKGVWQGSVIAVSYGGTGKSTLTTNGILYGQGTSAVAVTMAGTDGQIFSTVDGVPQFLSPSFEWLAATAATNGPRLRMNLSNVDYDSTMPVATTTASGAVTYGDQSFKGVKTFTSATKTVNIYPSKANSYTSGLEDYPWAAIYGALFNLRDSNSKYVGKFASTTAGTTTTEGVAELHVGNNVASGAAGNAKGQIYVYAANSTYAKFISTTTSNRDITIPDCGGNMVISNIAPSNPTTSATYYIPFYTTNYKKIGMNDGIRFTTIEGTASALGTASLILGNEIAGGTAKNKYGSIKFYGRSAESFTLTTNPTEVNESTDITSYTVYLPVADSATSELLYHPVNTAVGSSSRPVYISTSGKATAITTMSVSYGGTGKTTFTSNGILYGNGTSAINVTAAGSQGQVLSPNSSGVPSFASPSFTWNAGTTAGPTLSLNIQSKAWTSGSIPSASGTASGIVTTGSQTFAGKKTFSNTTSSTSTTTGAVIIKGGVGIAGNIYAGGNAVINGTGTIGGDLTVNGGEIYLGTSAEHCTMSYDANTDTLTISFPA